MPKKIWVESVDIRHCENCGAYAHKKISFEGKDYYLCPPCLQAILLNEDVEVHYKEEFPPIKLQNNKYNLEEKKLYKSSSVAFVGGQFSWQHWKDFGKSSAKDKFLENLIKSLPSEDKIEIIISDFWNKNQECFITILGSSLYLSQKNTGRLMAQIDENYDVIQYF